MRALVSVFDKENIVEFAKSLIQLDWEIVSTGGTYNKLKESGVDVVSIEDITEFPEILDGRVKTLNPKIHAGILYKRDNENHKKTMDELNLKSFDMIVCNLYPFEKTLKETNDESKIIEMIDIGGPSMLRAAAKNFKDVIVVTDKNDYDTIIEKLKDNSIDLSYKKELAKKVFETTFNYDKLIFEYFNKEDNNEFKETLVYDFKKENDLRYGENPHQKAAFYINENLDEKYLANIKKLHGKEISYNNLVDLNAAVKYVKYFDECATVAIKHRNPCGIAIGENPYDSYMKAYECDSESIFGGIVAFNRQVDAKAATEMSKIFLEIIVAPSFTDEAFEILSKKKNIRLIQIDNLCEMENPKYQINEVLNGIVIQEHDNTFIDESELEVVTKRKPTEKEMKDLKFAFLCVKAAASNGIVSAKDGATLGIGQGQTKRSWAVEEALDRAGDKIKGAVIASDAFFFKDTMELLKEYGVKAVIQPGGSIHDKEVIEYGNENDISVVFTHVRHFRHA